MQAYRRQRGASLVNMTVALGLIGFFALVGMKLVPVYVSNYTLAGILAGLERSHDAYESAVDVRDAISKRLSINNIDTVDVRDISVVPDGYTYMVDVNYEVYVPFVYNLTFLVEFNNHAEVHAR